MSQVSAIGASLFRGNCLSGNLGDGNRWPAPKGFGGRANLFVYQLVCVRNSELRALFALISLITRQNRSAPSSAPGSPGIRMQNLTLTSQEALASYVDRNLLRIRCRHGLILAPSHPFSTTTRRQRHIQVSQTFIMIMRRHQQINQPRPGGQPPKRE